MSAPDQKPATPGRPFAAGEDPRRSPGKPFTAGEDPRRAAGEFGADHQPRGKPWTAGELSALGTASDKAIGDQLGRSRASIIAKRRELGIAPHQGKGRPPKNA